MDGKSEQTRLVPILHSDKYLVAAQKEAVTAEEKKAFLESYYKSGNMSQASKLIGRDIGSFRYALTKDKAFTEDFTAIKNAMKHNLEETMYTNGLKEKGYMDRITWLRRNFPQEYNPNYVEKSTNPTDAIKELSEKLEDYQLIPKTKVIETTGEEHAS